MKKIAYICCLGVIGILTTEFGVIGILPQIADFYHIRIDKAGWLLSAFALVVALVGPFATLAASAFDRKRVMMASLGLYLITGIVSAMGPPFWLLLLVRVLPAILHAVYYSIAIATVTSGPDPKEGHRLLAITLNGITIASVTTIPLSTYVASKFNWQASFIVQSIVTGIALLGLYRVLPAMPVKHQKSYSHHLSILKKPDFLLCALMIFLMASAWFCSYSYFADYLQKAKHMSVQRVSYMMLLFGVAGIFGNWIAGKLLGKSIPMVTAAFLAGAIIIPVLLNYSGFDSITTMAVVIFWGFLFAPGFLNTSAMIATSVPEALEFANSLSASFGNLGVTVGTAVGGWIITTRGIDQVPWAGAVFGAASLVVVGIRTFYFSRKSGASKLHGEPIYEALP